MKSTFENIQAFITFKHLRCIHWNKWPLSERAGRLEGGGRGDREGGRAAKILNMKRKRNSDYNYYCQFMWTGIKYQSTQFYSCLGKRSSERPPEKSSCSVTELVSCSHLVPSFTVGSAWKTNENCTERMYIDVDVNTRLLIISFTILTCLDIGVGLQGRAGPCLQIEKDVLFPPYCQ